MGWVVGCKIYWIGLWEIFLLVFESLISYLVVGVVVGVSLFRELCW